MSSPRSIGYPKLQFWCCCYFTNAKYVFIKVTVFKGGELAAYSMYTFLAEPHYGVPKIKWNAS